MPAISAPAVRGRKHAVAVSVLVDGVKHAKLLSYLVPSGMKLRPGDAVEVPYGQRMLHGMVVELLDHPGKATRPISRLWGVRALPSEVDLALTIAAYHFVPPERVLSRLAPARGKGSPPLHPGDVKLSSRGRFRISDRKTNRVLLIPGPLVDRPALAAQEAASLCDGGGQVLVLCPTSQDVSEVMARFASGAVRLDAAAPAGSWTSFREGLARVGVGTRSAALYSAADLAGIVVLDESSPGHQEMSQPHTNARDLASARSRVLRCPLTLISTTPSAQAVSSCSSYLNVGGGSSWPRVALCDRNADGPLAGQLSSGFGHAIARAKRSGRPVAVLATSHSAVRRCRTCGLLRPCEQHPGLVCSHPEADPCSRCRATAVRTSGWDVTRLESIFGPDVSVYSLSSLPYDGTKRTVLVYDIDGLLYAPDLYLRAGASRVIDLACAAAGEGGEVVLGTTDLSNPLLRDLAAGRGMYPDALRRCKQAAEDFLPPAARMVTVTFFRKTPPDVSEWPGFVSTPAAAGDGRWEVVVRIDKQRVLELEPFIAKARKNSKARVKVA